jgi:hypothetical protein
MKRLLIVSLAFLWTGSAWGGANEGMLVHRSAKEMRIRFPQPGQNVSEGDCRVPWGELVFKSTGTGSFKYSLHSVSGTKKFKVKFLGYIDKQILAFVVPNPDLRPFIGEWFDAIAWSDKGDLVIEHQFSYNPILLPSITGVLMHYQC